MADALVFLAMENLLVIVTFGFLMFFVRESILSHDIVTPMSRPLLGPYVVIVLFSSNYSDLSGSPPHYFPTTCLIPLKAYPMPS
jgi:hypothetical protein